MLSFFRRSAFSFLGRAAKTSVIDSARVTTVTGLVWGSYYLYDKVSRHRFFNPGKPDLFKITNEPDLTTYCISESNLQIKT
ncbi:Uncharacterised protein [Legionella lansingensis]|uniref:Uncharacterized protein n=1 Tax=Legionella lansingensis TaxID=45067 RepID=A0A0W0VLR7_9GAMM|nr:hypothetical protein [Legionella lansingensis]KTD20974.1 hypothetical protein Llan_1704 [Legionella lansingensis]SNV44659.1 Uncharacterised protein [Legionella lansingensis]